MPHNCKFTRSRFSGLHHIQPQDVSLSLFFFFSQYSRLAMFFPSCTAIFLQHKPLFITCLTEAGACKLCIVYFVHPCVFVCVCVRGSMPPCARMCLCVCVRACVHVCVCAWLHVCVCTCMHVCMCTRACVHACVCLCVCVCVCVCVCMHVCVHACVHACMCRTDQHILCCSPLPWNQNKFWLKATKWSHETINICTYNCATPLVQVTADRAERPSR